MSVKSDMVHDLQQQRQAEQQKRREHEASLRAKQAELKAQLAVKEFERKRAALERDLRASFHARSQFIRFVFARDFVKNVCAAPFLISKFASLLPARSTRGELRIYWAPVRHNDATRQLLERSQKDHEAELQRAIAAKMELFPAPVGIPSAAPKSAAPDSRRRAEPASDDEQERSADLAMQVSVAEEGAVDEGVAAMLGAEQDDNDRVLFA